jgi:DNA-binding transcriptional LysR family regulator
LNGLPAEFHSTILAKKNFCFGLPDELVMMLLNETIDLAILTVKMDHPLLEYRLLEKESFSLIGSLDTNIPEKILSSETETEKWLSMQNWISFGEELPIIRRYWRLNFSKRPEIQSRIIIPNLLSIIKAVEMGYGISILPSYLIQSSIKAAKVRLLYPKEKSAVNELWFVNRKDKKNKENMFLFFSDLMNTEKRH